jgi:hypothetical protein
VHQHLGVLEALGVAGEVDVDEVGEVVDLFERGGGLFVVAVGDLLAGLLGHGVNELGVEVALLAGVGLAGAEFELGEELGAGFVGWRGRVGRGGEVECGKKKENGVAQSWIEPRCGAGDRT